MMKSKLRLLVPIFITNVFVSFSQGELPNLPADTGMPVPLDGIVIVSLLIGGTVFSIFFIKKKKQK